MGTCGDKNSASFDRDDERNDIGKEPTRGGGHPKMNYAIKILIVAAFAMTMSGASIASHICAYVDDDVLGPNFAEGYMVGPGSATSHVGPYSTNGSGIGGGFFTGGLASARDRQNDLYVGDTASDNITHFKINKTDCTLTLDTTLYPSGDTGLYGFGDPLAITPDGLTMFVGSTGDFHIYSHTIGANGLLGAPFTEASDPNYINAIEVSPNGKTLIVSYGSIHQVCAYPIAAGHLGTPNCQSAVGFTDGISIDPDSTCIYAAEDDLFGNGSGVAVFPLTEGIVGVPTDYKAFGPGQGSTSILLNWDNRTIYVGDALSAQITLGSVAPGCKLTYKAIIADGVSGMDHPSQIAQDKIVHGYVVAGDLNYDCMPTLGIFRASADGYLTPFGSGQFPLLDAFDGTASVVVVDAQSP